MTNHPNRNLLRARNAFPGDPVYILRRDVIASVGPLKKGTEITPLSAGTKDGRYERRWIVAGQLATYTEEYLY